MKRKRRAQPLTYLPRIAVFEKYFLKVGSGSSVFPPNTSHRVLGTNFSFGEREDRVHGHLSVGITLIRNGAKSSNMSNSELAQITNKTLRVTIATYNAWARPLVWSPRPLQPVQTQTIALQSPGMGTFMFLFVFCDFVLFWVLVVRSFFRSFVRLGLVRPPWGLQGCVFLFSVFVFFVLGQVCLASGAP